MTNVLTRAFIAGAITVVAATTAPAQLANGKWQAPAKSGGSAGSAPRQGTQVQRDNGAQTANNTNSNGAVPIRVIPAVVMSDGSIMADFGAGLEVVRRACPSSAANMPLRIVGSVTPTSPDPASSPAPDPTRAPVPNQATASQKMVSSQQRAQSQAAAGASCHLRDQRGRFFATR